MKREYLPVRGSTTVGDLSASINYALRRLPRAWDSHDVDKLVRVKWTANFPKTQWGQDFIEKYGDEFDQVLSSPFPNEDILQVEIYKDMRRGEIGPETTKAATKAFEFSGVIGDVWIPH